MQYVLHSGYPFRYKCVLTVCFSNIDIVSRMCSTNSIGTVSIRISSTCYCWCSFIKKSSRQKICIEGKLFSVLKHLFCNIYYTFYNIYYTVVYTYLTNLRYAWFNSNYIFMYVITASLAYSLYNYGNLSSDSVF